MEKVSEQYTLTMYYVTYRAVVLRTYSSMLSMSGRMVEIMVARPAALARLEMISRPSTLA